MIPFEPTKNRFIELHILARLAGELSRFRSECLQLEGLATSLIGQNGIGALDLSPSACGASRRGNSGRGRGVRAPDWIDNIAILDR